MGCSTDGARRSGPEWHSDPHVQFAGDVSGYRASFTDVASLPKPGSEAPLSSLYPHGVNSVLISETGYHQEDRQRVAAQLGVNVSDINPAGYQWHHAPTTGLMQLVNVEGHRAAHELDRRGSAFVTRNYGSGSG